MMVLFLPIAAAIFHYLNHSNEGCFPVRDHVANKIILVESLNQSNVSELFSEYSQISFRDYEIHMITLTKCNLILITNGKRHLFPSGFDDSSLQSQLTYATQNTNDSSGQVPKVTNTKIEQEK